MEIIETPEDESFEMIERPIPNFDPNDEFLSSCSVTIIQSIRSLQSKTSDLSLSDFSVINSDTQSINPLAC